MNDILQPFGSRCKFWNEYPISARNTTDRKANVNDNNTHPRGRIRTRPSRKLGLFVDLSGSDDVSSEEEESSPRAECRMGAD